MPFQDKKISVPLQTCGEGIAHLLRRLNSGAKLVSLRFHFAGYDSAADDAGLSDVKKMDR